LAHARPATRHGVNVNGPGAGPWEEVTPESQGLSADALAAAASSVSNAVAGRKCFVVVKNGKIVHETYYGGTTKASVQAGWSTTKSMCSTMFGIATEQGWASPNMKVSAKVKNQRKCNIEATFSNVLTMTGTSSSTSNPTFKYDVLGSDCYDALSDFVTENNPEGLNADDWKDKNFFGPIGMEHTRWDAGLWGLQCGTSMQPSCRDLARVAQMWLNDGEVPGVGQVVSKAHIEQGTKWVYPDQGDPYGYGLRLRPTDPIDNSVAFFGGIGVQCAFWSKKYNAIVVSMGDDFLGDCKSQVWEQARNSIVSKAELDDLIPFASVNATHSTVL